MAATTCKTLIEQAELARRDVFRARVQQAVVNVATRVLREHPNIRHHAARAGLALQALHEPERMAEVISQGVAAWYPAVSEDCQDLVITQAVESLWDVYAGVRVEKSE